MDVQRGIDFAKRFPFTPVYERPIEDNYLQFTEKGLSLLQPNPKKNDVEVLLHVDFIGGKNGYRFAKDLSIKQEIARAVGIKSGFRPTVFDATAGLGGDAFVLASLGCHVTLCERSPLLFSLVEDAMMRGQDDPVIGTIITERMHLLHGSSIDILDQLEQRALPRPYTVYMDPMYPHKKKSALNKKSMRVIRSFVGDDDDSPALLEAGLKAATNRVVVKRPKGAPYVDERKPHHEITMKNSRFDVYLV